jgi:hypothetical protein
LNTFSTETSLPSDAESAPRSALKGRSADGSLPSAVRCRVIVAADIGPVVDLLKKGFGSQRSRGFWQQMLERMSNHSTPAGMPKYGYLLEHAGRPVGVLLLISSIVHCGSTPSIRCNGSSWYVEPEFRPYGSLLMLRAFGQKAVTYLNISPARHTWPILEAQGYQRYSNGLFMSVPWLSVVPSGAVEVAPANAGIKVQIDRYEQDVLLAHAECGCISVWCVTEGRAYPFVFVRRMVWNVIPCLQLVYCRDMSDFVRFARPLGRYLALRGRFLVMLDANGPVAGMVGRYFHGIRPKYFKGPNPPRLGDLSYTEASLFGI